MATAFFLPLANLFAPLQALAAWFAPAAEPARGADTGAPAPRQPSRQSPARRLPGQGPVKLPS
ncbi:MAG TPA: hypothetical protein VGD76_06735, partial [Ramlibacter sp.]